MGDVQGVPTSAYLAMADALAEAPRDAGDRFAGTPQLQQALAAQMRGMFGVVPRRMRRVADDSTRRPCSGWLMILDAEQPRWSPGQYSAAAGVADGRGGGMNNCPWCHEELRCGNGCPRRIPRRARIAEKRSDACTGALLRTTRSARVVEQETGRTRPMKIRTICAAGLLALLALACVGASQLQHGNPGPPGHKDSPG